MEYRTLKELKNDWHTTKELFEFLGQKGYSNNIYCLKRWEKYKIVPQPKRATLKTISYRIYSKDGSDFKMILDTLSKNTKVKVVMTK